MIRKLLVLVSLLLFFFVAPERSNANLTVLRTDMLTAFENYSISSKLIDPEAAKRELDDQMEQAEDQYMASTILSVAQCISNIVSVANAGIGSTAGFVMGLGDDHIAGIAVFYAEDPNIDHVSILIDDEEIVPVMSISSTQGLLYADITLDKTLEPGSHSLIFNISGSLDLTYEPLEIPFSVVPAPGAFVLGSIGIGCVHWFRRRKHVL